MAYLENATEDVVEGGGVEGGGGGGGGGGVGGLQAGNELGMGEMKSATDLSRNQTTPDMEDWRLEGLR